LTTKLFHKEKNLIPNKSKGETEVRQTSD